MGLLIDPVVSSTMLGELPTKPYIYFSYPLIGLAIDERKALHATAFRLAYFVRNSCKPWQAYLPHESTDPVSRPEVPQGAIRSTDKAMVEGARLMVAFLEPSSAGVAIELEWCVQSQIPVLACMSSAALDSEFGAQSVSRLVLDTVRATRHKFFGYGKQPREGGFMREADERKLGDAIKQILSELGASR